MRVDGREAAGFVATRIGQSGERLLNGLEFCEYGDALGSDAAEIIRAVVKARRRCEHGEESSALDAGTGL
jgi:hypothetical protein